MIKFDFHDQVVLITGAASGIGAAQMQAFLQAGAAVVAVDQQPIATVDTKQLVTLQGDAQRAETATQAVELAQKNFGRLDIVCNTAGRLDGYQPILKTSLADWQTILTTDVTSQFNFIKAALPGMLVQHQGVFVNMASIAGMVAGGGGVAYTAAKHAVIGLTKQVAIDYAAQGIRANCLAPGAIDTPMNAADFAGDGKMATWVAQQTPVKRWANAAEVADLSLFLASPQAAYIQGAVVPIDGGWTAQ